jgi:hypothetical protein
LPSQSYEKKRTPPGKDSGIPLDFTQFHSYCGYMKNITVSVDDDVYHRARVKAAEKQSSVSRLVSEFLQKFVEEEDLIVNAREEMALLFERNSGGEYRVKMSRDEMHDA